MFKVRRCATDSPMTDIELFESLSPFSVMTQSAILLILMADITPDETLYLTWSAAKRRSWPTRAAYLLNKVPRHLFNDLVFWDNAKVCVPLLNLNESVQQFLGESSLAEGRRRFQNMLYVNDSSRAFISELSEQVFWRG